MGRDERLLELIQRWVYEEAAGRPVSPATLCDGDVTLLPELERLYRAGVRLELLMRWCEATATIAAGSAPPPEAPGYTVLGLLGEGSMGQVYLARHNRLDRQVALKVIRGGASPVSLARFRTEAQAAARLDHPNIVRVHEVGECPPVAGRESGPFLVMEYVSGGTLEAAAGTVTVPATTAARVVCLLARAAAHAHVRGIIHRDLKPSNVMMAPPGEEAFGSPLGVPKVADFGLARREGMSSPVATAPGTVMGTPAYMAPEQAEGKEAGPASDVYALGAILYRLLTGHVVFESDSMADTLHHVRHTPPRPPRELAAGVPPALEAWCLRCLDKDPTRRPTADGLAQALDGPAAAPPPPAPPPSRTSRLLVGALLALMVAALLVAWRPWTPAPTPPEPLTGRLDVRMTRPDDPMRQNLPLTDNAARPLKRRDLMRLFVELNRPAYPYIVWIDTSGAAIPVYPWVKHDWGRRVAEGKVASLRVPAPNPDREEWIEIGPGQAGIETLFLMCRETPLPEDVGLKELLAGLDPLPATGEGLRRLAWFRGGEDVSDMAVREPLPPPDDGVGRLGREIHRRVKGHFSLTRAFMFGNEGGAP